MCYRPGCWCFLSAACCLAVHGFVLCLPGGFFSLKIALLEFCFRDKVCNFFSNVYSFMVGDFLAGVWCIIAGAGSILLGCVMLPAWNTLFLTGLCCFFFANGFCCLISGVCFFLTAGVRVFWLKCCFCLVCAASFLVCSVSWLLYTLSSLMCLIKVSFQIIYLTVRNKNFPLNSCDLHSTTMI
jgi:hypothetical protein